MTDFCRTRPLKFEKKREHGNEHANPARTARQSTNDSAMESRKSGTGDPRRHDAEYSAKCFATNSWCRSRSYDSTKGDAEHSGKLYAGPSGWCTTILTPKQEQASEVEVLKRPHGATNWRLCTQPVLAPPLHELQSSLSMLKFSIGDIRWLLQE